MQLGIHTVHTDSHKVNYKTNCLGITPNRTGGGGSRIVDVRREAHWYIMGYQAIFSVCPCFQPSYGRRRLSQQR